MPVSAVTAEGTRTSKCRPGVSSEQPQSAAKRLSEAKPSCPIRAREARDIHDITDA
jgi:hypothetical protein